MKPLFSILHTSARPHAWRAVYDDWMAKAVNPEQVEYVLVIDYRWGFSEDPKEYDSALDNIRVVVNNRRRCYVDGVNLAAEACEGEVLIVNADDQFAENEWDVSIESVIQVHYLGTTVLGMPDVILGSSFVVEVSTGTPNEHERGVMVMPILSRARYEQQGFVFYPVYESMFADNDFCEAARKDGVVIDARHLMFPHRHEMFDGKGGWKREDWNQTLDAQYLAQNRGEAYVIGAKTIKIRQATGFGPLVRGVEARSIALCLSGESHHGSVVDSLLALQAHLIGNGYSVIRLRSVNNIVYLMREDTRDTLMKIEPHPELILFLDDDNPLSVEHFSMLLQGLEDHPEVDGVSGWCWIHRPDKTGFMVSCGEWAPDHLHWNPFGPSFAHEQQLRPFDTGGLPVMLMRFSALEKAGAGCFLPIVDNRLEHGISGEDMAFFKRAGQGGAKFLVDPRCRVPHVKYCEVEPVFPEEGKTPVKVACMIRAKNEGRWIGRTIASVRELCGADIYVMEDGSQDDTREVAERAGAIVLDSPFVGQPFNEVRDKDWLLDTVKGLCDPDWILMPDGDEELEPGACAKIRTALESNPPIDCFTLRFLYLWNSVSTWRADGIYGRMQRQSLFRTKTGLSFRSYYQGEGENANHCGLHCSNAPELGGMRLSPLNVFLLHYGYLHREDRIRKYDWIRVLDPDNEAEDNYRHSIQGDLPHVPADEVLTHAGPLELKELPPRLVPQFEGEVPGPFVREEISV